MKLYTTTATFLLFSLHREISIVFPPPPPPPPHFYCFPFTTTTTTTATFLLFSLHHHHHRHISIVFSPPPPRPPPPHFYCFPSKFGLLGLLGLIFGGGKTIDMWRWWWWWWWGGRKTIEMWRWWWWRENNRNEEVEVEERNKKHWGGKIIKIVEEGIKTLRRENNKIVEKGIKKDWGEK